MYAHECTTCSSCGDLWWVYSFLVCNKYSSNSRCGTSSFTIVNMAISIELFKFFQKINQTIGICPAQWNQTSYLSNNLRRAIFLISGAQFMFSTAAFFVIEAKTISEYGLSFCYALSALNSIEMYLIFIWQSQNTLEFIQHSGEFIGKSEC